MKKEPVLLRDVKDAFLVPLDSEGLDPDALQSAVAEGAYRFDREMPLACTMKVDNPLRPSASVPGFFAMDGADEARPGVLIRLTRFQTDGSRD